jgi:hypothetical protein
MGGGFDQWVCLVGVGLLFPDAVVPHPANSTKGKRSRSLRNKDLSNW